LLSTVPARPITRGFSAARWTVDVDARVPVEIGQSFHKTGLPGIVWTVGIARVEPQWIYEGYENDLPWIVVFGVEMNHAELAKAPEPESVIEVMRQYRILSIADRISAGP